MHHESDQFEEAADLDEVEAEIRAQIERFKSFGVEPSHLDNHMGSLYGIATGRLELLQLIFDLAAEYKLPFRFPSTFIPEMKGNISASCIGMHMCIYHFLSSCHYLFNLIIFFMF